MPYRKPALDKAKITLQAIAALPGPSGSTPPP